jgi:hypothetical protein
MSRVDRFLFETWRCDTTQLAIFRMVSGLYLLVLLFPVPWWVNDLPPRWFEPPMGPLLILESTPSEAALTTMVAVAALALVAMVVGWHTRWASLVSGLTLACLAGIGFSFGKIDHSTFAWLVPVAMSFSAWGDEISIDALRRGTGAEEQDARSNPGWPVALLLLFLAMAMAMAALGKLRGGWLDLSYSATRGYQLNALVPEGSGKLLAPLVAEVRWSVLHELMDWLTIAFELSFLGAIFAKRTMRWAVVVATVFHLAVVLTLNIAFMANLMVYMAVVSWPVPATVDARRRLIWGAGLGAAVAAVFAISGHPLARAAMSWADDGNLIISAFALFAASAIALRWAWRDARRMLHGDIGVGSRR